jgi:hypothetical protein
LPTLEKPGGNALVAQRRQTKTAAIAAHGQSEIPDSGDTSG